MGFCFLNNVAIAAYAALANGAKKVAIVDWDAHHGNGTEEIFDEDPRVLFVSLHRAGGYPSTGSATHRGKGAGLGTTVNVEMPVGSDSAAFAYAMRRKVLPAMAKFDADVLLVSSGFDAHVRDPLSDLALDSASFGAMAGALIASQKERPVGVFLEGGYDLRAIEESVGYVARAMLDDAPELDESKPNDAVRRAVDNL